MLREVHIKDFAIIEEIHVTLEPGFNILTGETGAGKSILIDAVALILGGRADTTAVRHGARRAHIEGLFVLDPTRVRAVAPILEREGLEGEATDALWLSREIRSSGRTVARVNGRVVSLTVMREIAEGLVDIHGQSEHLSLLRVREHLNLLDRFAGLEPLRLQVAEAARQLQGVRRDLKALRESERERMQRIDLLRFQVNEIESANLSVGEKKELEAESVRLSNAEQLTTLATGVLTLLEEATEESPAILDLLGYAQRDMVALNRIDPTLAAQLQILQEVGYQVEDLARTLRDYLADVEFNPKRLAWLENRLVLLNRLERKYGSGIDALLAYAEQASEELESLVHSDERIAELEKQETVLLKEAATLCQELSVARREACARLAAGVEAELNDLRMAGARFGVAFSWASDKRGLPLADALPEQLIITQSGVEDEGAPTVRRAAFDATGMDRVEFMVEPNPGEGLKPMTRVASGGETARLMLALKTVLSRADHTPTLIFDEIDQGIGGRVGSVVGAKLWHLTTHHGEQQEAVEHQVLCITHLPQLASFGDAHFCVSKRVTGERTVTQVARLDEAARVEELALMLGTGGETAQEGAQQILTQAAEAKRAPSR